MDRTETSRRRLETAFWNALDRRQDEKPAKAAGLAQKMEQATARRLNNSLSSIPGSLFRLTPQQWNTLQEAGMTAGQAALLGELDHRIKAVDEYHVNDLLEVIASAPESADGWKEWWTGNTRLAPRMQARRRQEQPAGDGEKLDGVVNLMAQAARGSIPGPAEAATSPEPPEKLSEALKRAHGVMELAAAMGIRAEECGYGDLSPETMSRELAGKGIRCEPDIGTLASPEELGKRPGWPGPDGFECDYETNLWWRKESAPPDGKWYTISESYRAMPERETPDPEIRLIHLTAPRLPDGRPDGLGALALRNGLTRRQAGQLLAGEPPDARTPGPCPMAKECATVCGEAQRREIIKFPPTESGDHEECGYYRFLAMHGRSPLREKAAEAEAERIVSAAKRARKEKEPEEEPDGEPEDGGETERRPAKRERKAKRPAGGQTMLGF